jgi:membrane protease YdiL (CAAX protease family)
VNQDLQLVSQGENQEVLGPFGRSFIGEFPTKGTLSIIALAILFDFFIAGGGISFLILSIITIFLVIYFCYNYIEPHFNSRIGVERRKKLPQITQDSDHLAMGDIGRLLHGYGKSAVGQVWDLSGKGSLREAFEGVPADLSAEQKSIGASDKTWVSWLIVLTFLMVWWVFLLIGSTAIFLTLYLVGISEGLSLSVSGLLVNIILIPITLLFIYVDGSLYRIKEMLRFGSVKRTLILILAIPIAVTIFGWILNIIYTVLWFGIFGEPSINTDMGTYWESSSIDIALLFLSVAIVTPIVEELMFRGYILDAINRKHSEWTAIIWSSILFGLLHLLGGVFYAGSALIGGLIYGWIRVRTGSLLTPIACHMIWNILALVVTYL